MKLIHWGRNRITTLETDTEHYHLDIFGIRVFSWERKIPWAKRHLHWLIAILALALCAGCSIVSYDRVFPKLTWYWSAEAKYQRAENILDKSKVYLWGRLSERDTKIVDLAEVGKSMVLKYGSDQSIKTITEVWNEQTGSQPATKAGDVIWLQNQSTRVRDLAWLINFQSEWNK